MITLFLAAWAGCEADLSAPGDESAVAWISPLRRSVGAGGRVRVVPVAALRKAAKKGKLTPGRVLQIVGERKKARDPRRAWKVTVFQASSGALCRPIEDQPETAFVAGLPVCSKRESKADKRTSGCGTTVDRAGRGQEITLYKASWRDLAPQGFCVFPLQRFLEEL